MAFFYQGQGYPIAKGEVHLSLYGNGYVDLTTVLFTIIFGFSEIWLNINDKNCPL